MGIVVHHTIVRKNQIFFKKCKNTIKAWKTDKDTSRDKPTICWDKTKHTKHKHQLAKLDSTNMANHNLDQLAKMQWRDTHYIP